MYSVIIALAVLVFGVFGQCHASATTNQSLTGCDVSLLVDDMPMGFAELGIDDPGRSQRIEAATTQSLRAIVLQAQQDAASVAAEEMANRDLQKQQLGEIETVRADVLGNQELEKIEDMLVALERLEVENQHKPAWSDRRKNAMRVVIALDPIIQNERLPELLAYFMNSISGQGLSGADHLEEIKRTGNAEPTKFFSLLNHFLVFVIGEVHLDYLTSNEYLDRASSLLGISRSETYNLGITFRKIYGATNIHDLISDVMLILLLDQSSSIAASKIERALSKDYGVWARLRSPVPKTVTSFSLMDLYDWITLKKMIEEAQAPQGLSRYRNRRRR